MPNRLRDTFVCGFGIIFGSWATYLAPAMGSTELLTASGLTVGAIGIFVWDFRKSVRRTGATGSVSPPPVNTKGP